VKNTLLWCLSVLAAVTTSAGAVPRTFVINQIYSNADGTVQFVVVHDTGQTDCDAGENLWAGAVLTSSGPGPFKAFTFPADLPTCHTSDHDVLIATEGFAALGLIPPDFVIPNNFLQMPSGTVALAGVTQVTYTALPNDGVHAIDSVGTPIQNNATNLAGATASVVPGAATSATVIEYYNAALDHYFITWATQEIADLDNGVHVGWVRTGQSFKTYTTARTGTSPVCRYYIPPDLGDSHFFGRGTAECAATGQKNPRFDLEDPAFMQMFLPAAGVCPANTVEVYRVFSNRVDANHRYMTDKAIRAQMTGKGWVAEGDGPDVVVMCAPQ